jgi:hypothetical protein
VVKDLKKLTWTIVTNNLAILMIGMHVLLGVIGLGADIGIL